MAHLYGRGSDLQKLNLQICFCNNSERFCTSRKNFRLYCNLVIVSHTQAAEFFFFSGIITVVAILYSIMSYFYKYVDITHDSRYPLPRGAINVKREEDEGALLEQDEEEASSVVNENFTEPLETGL